jgi:Tfp pilus assembly protein PilO
MPKFNFNIDPKEKQKIYLLIGIFVVAGVTLYFNVLLKPMFSNFIVMNREYYKIRTKVNNAKMLLANKAKIEEQYNLLKGQAEEYGKRFPNQAEVSSLLGDFSNVAEASNVKISRIRPLEDIDIAQATGSNDLYYEYPILIEARGGYHQLGVFFNKLEGMERFIKVNTLDVKSNSQDPRRHNIIIKVSTYIM